MRKIVRMATAAEKKALVFVGVVALLGVSVRLWRLQHLDHPSPPRLERLQGSPGPGERSWKSSKKARTNTRSKRPSYRDSTRVIDLDRASAAEIEALGVLKPGVARLIVADRDSFGPFGSIYELGRVPYLKRSELIALAPRVTFSLLPRPKNAVIKRYRELDVTSGQPETAPPSTPKPTPRRRRPSLKRVSP